MDTYFDETERFELSLDCEPDEAAIGLIREAIGAVEGADLVGVAGNRVSIDRYPAIASKEMVAEAIERLGLHRKSAKKQGFLARRLNRMAESNRKQFGEKRLDCCELDN